MAGRTLFEDPVTGIVFNRLTGEPVDGDPLDAREVAGALEELGYPFEFDQAFFVDEPVGRGNAAVVVVPESADDAVALPLILPVVVGDDADDDDADDDDADVFLDFGAAGNDVLVPDLDFDDFPSVVLTSEDLERPDNAKYLGKEKDRPTFLYGKFEEELDRLFRSFTRARTLQAFEDDDNTQYFVAYMDLLYPRNSQQAPKDMAKELNSLEDMDRRLSNCGRDLEGMAKNLETIHKDINDGSDVDRAVKRAAKLVRAIQGLLNVGQDVQCSAEDQLSTILARLGKARENVRVKRGYWNRRRLVKPTESRRMLESLSVSHKAYTDMATKIKALQKETRPYIKEKRAMPRALARRLDEAEKEAGLLLTRS